MAEFFASNWSLLLLVAIIPIFYFLMIRPQKKQEQQQAQMRNSLQVGDEITTIGGIIGKITSIKGETVTIETSKDKTKIRFLRTAIRSVDVKAEESIVPTKKAEEAEQPKNAKGKKTIATPKDETPDETEAAEAPIEAAPETDVESDDKKVVLNGESVDADNK